MLSSYQKQLIAFVNFLTRRIRDLVQGTLQKINTTILYLRTYLYLLTSHRSTSAQESPSTPSVLQTAYAKGSTVSSVISEPILPPIPLTLTLLPLLH